MLPKKYNMKFRIVSSLLLGLCSFSSDVSNVRAELSLHSSPPAIGQTDSLIIRAENVNGNVAPLPSVESAAPEAKLFRRTQPLTTDEEQLLLKLRQEQERPWREIIEYFPGRKLKYIQARYYTLRETKQEESPKDLRAWTDEEKEILLDLRKTGQSWREIAKDLPGRSVGAIIDHYYYLKRDGHPPRSSRNFSAEEDELLLELAEADIPWEERVKYFNNRTSSSLRGRLTRIRPTKQLGKFSSKEDNLIIKSLKKGKILEEIAQMLGRSVEAVGKRIKFLEKSNRVDPVPELAKNRRYTAAEYDLMHEMYIRGMSWKYIATEYFPGRSSEGLRASYYHSRIKKQKGEGDNSN